ncbi:MAG: hypothetical protein XU15_C0002G0382 [candidate division NC10 bacterium CSP1-5]|nr:MAG: hypothetical protein XU15_C0002G0382 [candidate division NC10 bacterium CSP1-5]
MTSRELKFRHAAWAYAIYGACYLGGAVYLAAMGVAPRALTSRDWIWFALGGMILILFPWLLWRGYTWFARLLVFLMALRAFEVLKIALAPGVKDVALPGGGSIPMTYGALAFFLLTVGAAAVVARAAWDL